MIEESYCVVMEFGDFDKFYSFLDGDLFDAELRNFDFKGIDLKQYNICLLYTSDAADDS